MKDHHRYVRENGERVPPGKMTDEEINHCLQFGITRTGGREEEKPGVLLRLEIERIIRSIDR